MVGDQFDVIVEDDDVVEVHDEEIEDFLVVDVVSAHLVESVLRTEDVVHQVQSHEAIVDQLHDVLRVHPPLGVCLNGADCPGHQEHRLKTHKVFLEILAVERDDVFLYEVTASVLEGDLYLLLLLRGTMVLDEVFIDLIQYNLDELRIVGLLDDAVRDDESLYPYHLIFIPNLFEEESDQLFPFGGFLLVTVDTDVDLLGDHVCEADVDV